MLNQITFPVTRDHQNALIGYAHEQDAGADVVCLNTFTMSPGQRLLVPTGLRFQLPLGVEAQIRSKSGLAMKGIIVLNSPGTIDSGYTGEIKILLMNVGDEWVQFKSKEKIAQIVFARHLTAVFDFSGDWEAQGSKRGEGGFGSTGSEISNEEKSKWMLPPFNEIAEC